MERNYVSALEKTAKVLAGTVLLTTNVVVGAIELAGNYVLDLGHKLEIYLDLKEYERRHKKHMQNFDPRGWY